MDDDQNVYDYDTYPHRVYRFVPALENGFIAKLDRETNVLTIDKSKFDALYKEQRSQIYLARGDVVVEG